MEYSPEIKNIEEKDKMGAIVRNFTGEDRMLEGRIVERFKEDKDVRIGGIYGDEGKKIGFSVIYEAESPQDFDGRMKFLERKQEIEKILEGMMNVGESGKIVIEKLQEEEGKKTA